MPQRKDGPPDPPKSQDVVLDPPSRDIDADAPELLPASPQQMSKIFASGLPGWRSEVPLPCDRDDEVNFRNFTKALAITSGSSVSVELSQLL